MTVVTDDEVERPVAWRWRYVYPKKVGHWTLRATPIEPHPASPGFAGVECEPLYARAALAASDRDVLVAALRKIAEMTDIEADFDGFEAREIAVAALLPLGGGS